MYPAGASKSIPIINFTQNGTPGTSPLSRERRYHQLENAYKAGKLKAIGISNFTPEEVRSLLANCEILPQLIQVEAHPYFPETELKEVLKEKNIALQAWYPLGGRGNMSIQKDPVIIGLAEKYGKSPAQIILRWAVQMNHIVIPGSKTKAHILDNISIFDFELGAEDMAAIACIDKGAPFFVRSDAMLAQFALWRPNVDNQK